MRSRASMVRVGGGVGEMSDGGDAAVLDGEVGALPGIAAAIDDAGVADEDVVVRGEERRDQEDKGDEAHWDISSIVRASLGLAG